MFATIVYRPPPLLCIRNERKHRKIAQTTSDYNNGN